MARSSLRQQWFTFTVGLLGAGMAFQVLAMFAYQRWSASQLARSWFEAATTLGAAELERATTAQLELGAARLARAPELRAASPAELAAMVNEQLGGTDGRPAFHALVDRDGRAPIVSDPGCVAGVEALARDRSGGASAVIACSGSAVRVVYRELDGERWRGLVVGFPLDDRFAATVAKVTMAEALVLVGGAPVASSMSDGGGRRASVVLPPALARPLPGFEFASANLTVAGYRGFGVGETPRRIALLPTDAWFYGARPMTRSGDVRLVLMAPKSAMQIGANYGLAITAAISLLLLTVMAVFVRALTARLTRPLAALTASATAVAEGDLTRSVPEADAAELKDFCRTYNTMLDEMRELMALRQHSARLAGRAEVVTGVLHNVGNVLNSVNVSLGLALESAESTRRSGVRKLGELLERHRADLAGFFASDPRGQRIPEYVLGLANKLEDDRAELARELGQVAEGIEHIKRIVSTQQRYAQPSGVVEACTVEEVVDDALRIDTTSLRHHGVDVTVELARCDASLDRHKLLQILLNLLTNAKHAVARNAGDKRVTIRTEALADGRVRVTVADNGEGIAPSNRSRIFTQGFTTKPHGHGIGLHNSILAAREMGGDLTFTSDGEGKGATFIVELPRVAPPAAAAASLPPPSLAARLAA